MLGKIQVIQSFYIFVFTATMELLFGFEHAKIK